ncbi:hypothetical protein BU198_06470 [Streptomyces sp. CBMA156]|nr:hypothetical protein [Streptomyces sp. CBMA156]
MAGVLVLGGAVAGAVPASAVPPVRPAGAVRTVPERAPQLRTGARVHRITESSLAKSKKHGKRHGSHGGSGALLTWLAVLLLLGVLVAVLAVLWFRRRNRRRPQEG